MQGEPKLYAVMDYRYAHSIILEEWMSRSSPGSQAWGPMMAPESNEVGNNPTLSHAANQNSHDFYAPYL